MRAKRIALICLVVSAGLLYLAAGLAFSNGGWLAKIEPFIRIFAPATFVLFAINLAAYLVLSRRFRS